MKGKFRSVIAPVSVLFISVAILVLGSGLQGTLLGVRAAVEGMEEESIGVMMSAYFGGYVVGSLFLPRWIESVGHIRTFAALASMASSVALCYVLFVSPLGWTLLRLLQGACYAGLVMVTESWLNGVTEGRYRGRVLAFYYLILMGFWALSQQLMNLAPASSFVLFMVVSICLSLALVPVTLARVTVPSVVTATRLSLRRLYAISPLSLSGVFVVGLSTGAFFGMGPLFAKSIGLSIEVISAFMSMTMMGALFFQWPLGWLSDIIDRRQVIIWAALGATSVSMMLAWQGEPSPHWLLPLAFLWGGFLFPVYPLCVAHANDHISPQELIAAASGLILVNGVGLTIGPFAVSLVMGQVGPAGFFFYMAAIQCAFVFFGFFRLTQRGAVLKEDKEPYESVPSMSHVATQMDKRGLGNIPGKKRASE